MRSLTALFAALAVPLASATIVASPSDTATIVFVDCNPPLPGVTPPPNTYSTLEAARDYVRTLQPFSYGDVVVEVATDCVLNATLALEGSQDSNVIWRSAGGSAVYGGVELNRTRWTEVPASQLAELGFTAAAAAPAGSVSILAYPLSPSDLGPDGYGVYHNGGLGQCAQTRAELFVGGVPMMVARYPNAPLEPGEPWMDWIHVGAVGKKTSDSTLATCPQDPVSDGREWRHWSLANGGANCAADGDESSDLPAYSFTVDDIPRDVAARVANTSAAEITKIWAHGFWAYDWADNYVQLENATLGGENGANLTLAYNPKTPPVYRMSPHARFYLTNLRCELDSPGEYYFAEEESTLYFVTDGTVDPRFATARISTVTDALLTLTDVTNVTIEGIAFHVARENGIIVSGGSNINILRVESSNVGRTAVAVSGASQVMIANLTSLFAGCRAVSAFGGDTMTLEPSYITITDSSIQRYARWTRTYNPGVGFGGVGIQVANSSIGHAPHNALQGGGNNHLFTNNQLFNLCYEVRDSGAFYIGRSWTDRGMVLKDNTFTNVVAIEPTFLGSDSVQAMYFDDEQSGVTAIGNTCINVHACFLVGGGRDNTVHGNTCVSAQRACILFDNRGMNWQKEMCTNSSKTGPGELVAQLEHVHYQQPPYSVEYPRIVNTMQDRPCVPVGNVFSDNRCCMCDQPGQSQPQFIDQGNTTLQSWGSTMFGNVVDC